MKPKITEPLLELPDITTFWNEFNLAIDDPEIQKAAVSGLIQEIIVHPTAALEIQCNFQFLPDSATAYRTPV